MEVLTVGLEYFVWHYTRALRDIWRIAGNFFWFVWHFFSVELLAKNIFAPWKRLGEEHEKNESIGDYFGIIAVNILMRAVGAVSRIVLLVIAAFTLAALSFFTVMAYAAWLAVPVGMFILIIAALKNLLTFPV